MVVDWRKTFLIEYYKKCWDNVNRAEDAAWKMMAAYATLIAGLSFVYDRIGVVGFLLILMAFSFFSISIAMNANLWFIRNINLISNFEKEFLDTTDYNYIVPKFFAGKRDFFTLHPRTWEAWWIHVFSYFLICSIFIFILWPKLILCSEKILILVFYFLGIIWSICYAETLKSRSKDIDLAPGKVLPQ